MIDQRGQGEQQRRLGPRHQHGRSLVALRAQRAGSGETPWLSSI